ncbi:Uncharacterized protein HZ326_6077 [Fusarium oxysporum f. sp. albedinis]|nr:Uncharacterized protein HZ326_6077 [Fusarium oxysporum f. sp. albedinis]
MKIIGKGADDRVEALQSTPQRTFTVPLFFSDKCYQHNGIREAFFSSQRMQQISRGYGTVSSYDPELVSPSRAPASPMDL